jgi:hypothetical protein
MGTRYYDPALGRFTQVDPVEGGSANRYDYAGQNPVNNSDPTGTACGPRLLDLFVPDFVFTGPCRTHDECWGKWENRRAGCDEQFKAGLNRACARYSRKGRPPWGALNRWAACNQVAESYYNNVHSISGTAVYVIAQSKACPRRNPVWCLSQIRKRWKRGSAWD